MTIRNRLDQETSPYLLQHAHHPVHWQPWDNMALSLAQTLNRPILLSIGYSACHWCHVMAHESFEDTETADLMNQRFINIKVDREERPDIDKIYQLAHTVITHRGGGWPLTMFLTPDQTPFFGGTYFPLTPQYGMPTFKEIVTRVSQYLNEQPEEIHKQNESLREFLQSLNNNDHNNSLNRELAAAILDQAREDLNHHFDPINGGFGQAPKFPHSSKLERAFLQWHASHAQDQQSKHIAEFTLSKMAQGGLYDHLAGGFFRYSVDGQWIIPHFEKMLYDNGPLISLYTQAAIISSQTHYLDIAKQTADWAIDEMQSEQGGFYSTLDADSEGHEGRFYCWDTAQVQACLSDDEYTTFSNAFNLKQAANFEGRWHLHTHQAVSNDTDDEPLLKQAKAKLKAIRDLRAKPFRDEKILTAWNALIMKGLAQLGRFSLNDKYTTSANRALDFIMQEMRRDDTLFASYKNENAKYAAYLDDYAFLLDALFELIQTHWDFRYIDYATWICQKLLTQFEDKASGGFYFTSEQHEQLLYRPKSNAEESMPSGSAVASYSLNRWGHLLGKSEYIQAAERAVISVENELSESPLSHCGYILALEEILEPPEILILRCQKSHIEKWQKYAATLYQPHTFLFIIANETNIPKNENTYSFLNDKSPQGDQALFHCQGYTCQAPITNETDIKDALSPNR